MNNNVTLDNFYQRSARDIIQRGTLSATLGSISVSVLLFLINMHYEKVTEFFVSCCLVLLSGNIYRLFLYFNKSYSDEQWFKRLKWTHVVVMLGFCGIFFNSYLDKSNFSNIVISYLVINALVSSAVFWQFIVKSDIVTSITCYLLTAAIGFFIWSDDAMIQLYGTTLIGIYFIFLMKQAFMKRDSWLEQKKNEFELRKVVYELPQSLFSNQKLKSLSQSQNVNEYSISELQTTMVSQLKQLISENELKTLELARTDKMASIGEMLSGIMHEINNPISIITSRIQLISNYFENEKVDIEAIRKSFDVISRNAYRTSKIIAGVKTLVRETNIENFVDTELKEIILNTNDAVGDKLKKNNIILEINLDKCDENYRLFCFPLQISQVLVNLIGNSCDALKNSDEKWIRVRFESNASCMLISVTDSGLGLNAETQKRIEAPFYTTKKESEGTGIGLHISKKIIESHKGRFYYNSNSQNTQFVIELPIQLAA